MPSITCVNEDCGADIPFNLSQLNIEDEEPSGNHTTQYSGSGEFTCQDCNSETSVTCVWDEENDTGEILSLDIM